LQLAASMVVFMLAGIWADTHWGISPWGTIGGLVLGATGALVKFIRTAMELGKAADAEAREAHTKR
jgi:F0F1-type ATP synthase assembly protein I